MPLSSTPCVYPSASATPETTGNTQWDGYQTWSEVYLIANPSIRGWVEQGSVVGASQASAPVPNWTASVPAFQPQNPAPDNGGWRGQGMPNWTTSVPVFQAQGMPGFNIDGGWRPNPAR